MFSCPQEGHKGAKASKVLKVPTVFEGAHSGKEEVCYRGIVSFRRERKESEEPRPTPFFGTRSERWLTNGLKVVSRGQER
jgi:hypothetical protein